MFFAYSSVFFRCFIKTVIVFLKVLEENQTELPTIAEIAKPMPTDKLMSSTSLKDLAREIDTIITEKRKEASEPLSWEFAVKCYKVQCFYWYRKKSVWKEYEKSMALTSSIWDGIDSLIKHEVFGMKRSFDGTAGRHTVWDPIKGN